MKKVLRHEISQLHKGPHLFDYAIKRRTCQQIENSGSDHEINSF